MSNSPSKNSVDEIPYNVMNFGEECEFLSNPLDPLDDLWSLYQGILEQPSLNDDYQPNAETIPLMIEQQPEITPQEGADKDSKENKELKKFVKVTSTSSRSKKSRKVNKRNGRISDHNVNRSTGGSLEQRSDKNVGEGPSSSTTKKQDHNAKERIRRMKLNASYLALRALLPDSRRSKKRWSAPSVVDKVLKYIPELENEIEELKSKKEEVQSAANKNKPADTMVSSNGSSTNHSSTAYVTEVNQDEAIVQICMTNTVGSTAFANMLEKVEDKGICVKSASTMYVCEGRISSHLHIQMNRSSDGTNSIADLEDKFNQWLRI